MSLLSFGFGPKKPPVPQKPSVKVKFVIPDNLGSVVLAKHALLVEEATGRILWERDPYTPTYPASTTKIMTGLLLLENTKPDDVIVAPKDIEKIKESSMHLKPLERVRAKDMIYALMLRSANDGCYATACHIAGDLPKFVEMMNARAKEIGCQGTSFTNANGLNDPNHKTTAFDLFLMAREAMKREDFRRVVSTKKIKISRSLNFKDMWMVNRNKFLWRDKTADGVKTGYTVPSGATYVGSATRNGVRYYTVLLNSSNWKADHKVMLEWAFSKFERTLVRKAGKFNARDGTPIIIKDPIYICHPVGKSDYSLTHIKEDVPGKPDQYGFLEVDQFDGTKQRIPLYYDGARPGPIRTLATSVRRSGLNWLWIGGSGLLLAFAAYRFAIHRQRL